MNKPLAIIGASGHGKVVADVAELLGYTVYFYDDEFHKTAFMEHWPVLGNTNNLIETKHTINVVVAIGNNEIREQKTDLLKEAGFNFPSLVHPSAIVSKYANVGFGSVIFANAVISAFTKIGSGCIINTGAIVDHDCKVGNFVHISPNSALAGGVSIGEKSWIGIGSCIKQLVHIGENTNIGAGSTVLQNIPDNVTAFGSPCVVRNINGK